MVTRVYIRRDDGLLGIFTLDPSGNRPWWDVVGKIASVVPQDATWTFQPLSDKMEESINQDKGGT